MTLLDAGAGDGLIGFGAIDRIGDSLRIIFADVSAPLLKHTEQRAIQRGVGRQCVFLQTRAEQLGGIGDCSVNVVTTRAVLAYVAEKDAALREFHRVLKNGGRISICEPIAQDEAFEAVALTKLIETQPAHADIEFLRLYQRWKAEQFPTTEKGISLNPLTNFSERDLVRFAREAGFGNIHMELHIDHRPPVNTSWEIFLDTSAHPWSPTTREIFDRSFSAEDQQVFERKMRPMVESGQTLKSEAIAYLTAEKP